MNKHEMLVRLAGVWVAAVLVAVPSISAAAPACKRPMAEKSYAEAIDSTVPSDLTPGLLTPPTPTTRIFFNVLTPKRCPGDTFPVVFNYAAWGTQRIKHLAVAQRLLTNGPMAISEEEFLRQLPQYGYIVISADPRGIGDSVPANGGGVQRLMDPAAEIQDARQILDWAYDHAEEFGIQTEPDSGIAKDIKVGTFGLSYGGGFQMSLAALDPRIDAIVPTMTWNDIYYSIVPGGAVKLGWAGFLCLSGTAVGQQYSPYLGALCRIVGPSNPQGGLMRTMTDVSTFVGVAPGQTPTQMQLARQQQLMSEFGLSAFPTQAQVIDFLERPGAAWFASQQAAAQPWGYGESQAVLRPVPALFVQGNSDLLFNLTEGYWNWRYFKAAGGDTRLISTNGGHNAFLGLRTGDCGSNNAVTSTLAWFDHYLKGEDSDRFAAIPQVCISVSNTVMAPHVRNVGVEMSDFPVGSLSGAGAVPATRASVDVTLGELAVKPVFVPVTTVAGNDKVLAGVPTIASLTVTRGQGALPNHQVAAFVATGIRRHGQLIAVDQQVTGFAEGTHTRADENVQQDDRILLPAVGEQLRDGDEVGLLFYPQTYAFTALTSAQTATGVPLLLEQLMGINAGGNLLSAGAAATGLAYINPYQVTASDVELPIFVPGEYADSQLSQ